MTTDIFKKSAGIVGGGGFFNTKELAQFPGFIIKVLKVDDGYINPKFKKDGPSVRLFADIIAFDQEGRVAAEKHGAIWDCGTNLWKRLGADIDDVLAVRIWKDGHYWNLEDVSGELLEKMGAEWQRRQEALSEAIADAPDEI